MTRIRITKAAEQHTIAVSNTSVSADIPIDGQFHDVHPDLLSVLDNSAVEYEVEAVKAASPKRSRRSRATAAGGAAGLGDSAAPLTRSAKARANASRQARKGGKFAKA